MQRDDTQNPDDSSGSTGGNWWEGPRPSYVPATAPWPPPLPPGASYGPNVGQIIYAPGTQPSNPQQPQPGVDTPVTVDQPTFYPPPNDDTPPPPPTPAPGPSTGGGSLITPFGDPAPVYNPTPIGTAPTFQQPTMAEAMNDDGYKFVLDQGNKNLESWLSSRGTANDSSAAKAFIDYGQGAAGTQYGNVWNRAYGAYSANMGAFNANAANQTHLNDTTWQNNWNTWLQNWNIFRDQRDSTFNHQLAVS